MDIGQACGLPLYAGRTRYRYSSLVTRYHRKVHRFMRRQLRAVDREWQYF